MKIGFAYIPKSDFFKSSSTQVKLTALNLSLIELSSSYVFFPQFRSSGYLNISISAYYHQYMNIYKKGGILGVSQDL